MATLKPDCSVKWTVREMIRQIREKQLIVKKLRKLGSSDSEIATALDIKIDDPVFEIP